MNNAEIQSAIQALIDKQAITDVLHIYCRGMDRGDTDILASAYWSDAYEEHTEIHQSPVGEFIKWSTDTLKPMRTAHRLSNLMIELDDTTHARSESYVWAYHSIPMENGQWEDVVAGVRYLDHLEKRDEDRKILRRKLVLDYFTKQPASDDMGFFGALEITGRRDKNDPFYTHRPLV